jgi:hypothetical protein
MIVFLRSLRRLLVTANVHPSSQILVVMMMEALRSFETSVLTRATRRNIAEDVIFTMEYSKKYFSQISSPPKMSHCNVLKYDIKYNDYNSGCNS